MNPRIHWALPSLLALALGLTACQKTPDSSTRQAEAMPPAPAPAPAKAGEEVFYHLFQRSFRDGNGDRIGDLAGLTEKLDYLKDLGVTSLLLTPLQPSPFYHNYFPTDFEGIDPAYGTHEDYLAFVRAAHARGLKVYLDQEIQYVAEGHPWWTKALQNPDAPEARYLLWRDAKKGVAEPFLDRATWEHYDGKPLGIAMVNLDNPEVRDYFQRVLLSLADPHGDGSGRDGVDGFRIDHMMDDLDNKGLAKNLFAGFWRPIFDALRQRRPGLRILAEQSDWGYGEDWLVRGDADLVFAFPLRAAITALDKRKIDEALRETERITPKGKGQIVFIENHDTERYMSLIEGDATKARAGAALSLLAAGEPLLYYGQELGMRGLPRSDPSLSDRAHIPLREAFRWSADLEAPGSAIWYADAGHWWWDERSNHSHDGVSLEEEVADPDSLFHWYQRLLALRQSRAELRHGTQRILCEDAGNLVCLLRETDGARTLLLVNLGTTPAAMPADAATVADGMKELLASTAANANGERMLTPMEVRILGTP
ncbi:MAG: alpha-amylase family glycosyl hydrolase [Pseudoxanthomonas sp.]